MKKYIFLKTTFIESTLEYITVSNFYIFLSTSNKPSPVKKFPFKRTKRIANVFHERLFYSPTESPMNIFKVFPKRIREYFERVFSKVSNKS